MANAANKLQLRIILNSNDLPVHDSSLAHFVLSYETGPRQKKMKGDPRLPQVASNSKCGVDHNARTEAHSSTTLLQHSMICALVGLSPPNPRLGDHVKRQVTCTIDDDDESHSIEWRKEHALALDEDHDNAETLLLTAVTNATAESVLETVKKAVKDYEYSHEGNVCCELWASAPAPLPLRPLDGYDRHIDIKDAALAMKQWGLVIQKQTLTAKAVAQFRQVVDTAIQDTHQALEQYQPQLTIGQDSFCFREIASRNKERFDLRLVELEHKNLVKEWILEDKTIQEFLQTALGFTSLHSLQEEIDFDLSVVYSRPGACAQGWHADGNHIPGAFDAGWGQNGWEKQLANAYAICLFVPLIDLNEQVGYTQFWPGSHQQRDLVGFGPVARVTQSVWNGNCKAGDGIWYDYRLMHQGMPNTTANVNRPVLQIIFKKKWYVEKENYGVQSLYETPKAKTTEQEQQDREIKQ